MKCNFLDLFKELLGGFNGDWKEKAITVDYIPSLEALFADVENPACSWGSMDQKNRKLNFFVGKESCGSLSNLDIGKIKSFTGTGDINEDASTLAGNYWSIETGELEIKEYCTNILQEKIPLPYPKFLSVCNLPCKLHFRESGCEKIQFKQETPVGFKYAGTLLICLPTTYKGGKLLVKRENQEKCIEFNVAEDDAPVTQWAFISAGSEHELEPILEGVQIIIQRNFFEKEETKLQMINCRFETGKSSYHNKSIVCVGNKMNDSERACMKLDPNVKTLMKVPRNLEVQANTLAKILKDLIKHSHDFGVILSHYYITENSSEFDLLRGRDRILYNLVLSIKDQLPPFTMKLKYLMNEGVPSLGAILNELASLLIDPSLVIENLGKEKFIAIHHSGSYYKNIYHHHGFYEELPEKKAYISCLLTFHFGTTEADA